MTTFKDNLRLLCSYYKSIFEVCRRLGINRPQFNRYLSGINHPASNKMRRFYEFFGVEYYEILLLHQQVLQLVQMRPKSHPQIEEVSAEVAHLKN